jgi:acyl-CoA reductase-like NAD-dependent aldehyde dehydrogenase
MSPALPTAYVGTDWLPAGDTTISVTDPSTGEIIGEVPALTSDAVEPAVRAALTAQRPWAKVPPVKRARVLGRAAALLAERAGDLAETLAREGGRPRAEAAGEIAKTVTTFEYYAGLAGALDGRAFDGGEAGLRHETRHQPVGLVAAVTPWNVPAASPARKLAPALLAGNAVLLKPASATPLTAGRLVAALYDAGLPAGLVQVLTGSGGVVGQAVCLHPAVGAVSFTGSTEVGMGLQRSLAGTTTKLQLELGGKNAAVVLPDADLDRAADFVVAAAFASAGQQCTATSRLLIHRDIADTMLALVLKRVEALVVGPTADSATTMGPLVDEAQVAVTEGFVARAVAQGAAVATGGNRISGPGCYYAPTVLTVVDRKSEVAREEVFGPVLTVFEIESLSDAIELVDDTPYGLSCAIHTNDLRAAQEFAAGVHCGVVAVNGPTAGIELPAPFGGFKASGTASKEHGPESMEFFTLTKLVSWRW